MINLRGESYEYGYSRRRVVGDVLPETGGSDIFHQIKQTFEIKFVAKGRNLHPNSPILLESAGKLLIDCTADGICVP